MVGNQRIEQRFVGILEIPHEAVLLERRGFLVQTLLSSFSLLFQSPDMWRQQSVQTKGVPFALHERSSFVESWMDEQIVSGQIRFHASSKVNILSRFAYIQYSRVERQRANGSELADGTDCRELSCFEGDPGGFGIQK